MACTPIAPLPSGSDRPQTTLKQVLLQRTDRQGQLLWRLQADQVIMRDPQVIHLQRLQGTFYHNQAAIYTLTASQGKVYPSSEAIQLEGPIVLQDRRDRSTLHSENIQWNPHSGQLIATSGVRLDHPQVNLQGQRLQASTQTDHVHITGQVVVYAPEHQLQLQTQQLTWWARQRKVQAHSGAQTAVKLVSTSERTWQEAEAQWVEIHLPTQQVILQQAVQMKFTQANIQLRSAKVVGDLVRQQWHSPEGIQIRYQDMTATAVQGWLDRSQTLQLQDQVQLQGLPNQAHLNCQRLTWNLATQDLKAQGNLVYQQATPQIKLTGASALGNLQHQTLAIQDGETVAEILP